MNGNPYVRLFEVVLAGVMHLNINIITGHKYVGRLPKRVAQLYLSYVDNVPIVGYKIA